MQANPILVETMRGNWVENIHRGAFCVVDKDGNIIAAAGDVARPIFPRSAIKAMQALALFRSGAVKKFSLDDEAIALACASHNGEPKQVEAVERFLQAIECSIDDLECGAQPPVDAKTRRALVAAGTSPSAIHNNCSGKHAGMLAVAKALGAPTSGYSERDHQAQKLVRTCVEAIIGEDLTTDRCGTDGCSIPTWASPLENFARGFSRMTSGNDLSVEDAHAAGKIFDAATANPYLIRGTNALDSDLMTAFSGRLMVKIGAEGVFCGALRDRGLGFALKVDDGNIKAAEVLVATLLLAVSSPNEQEVVALNQYAQPELKNWRGLKVGRMQATSLAHPKI